MVLLYMPMMYVLSLIHSLPCRAPALAFCNSEYCIFIPMSRLIYIAEWVVEASHIACTSPKSDLTGGNWPYLPYRHRTSLLTVVVPSTDHNQPFPSLPFPCRPITPRSGTQASGKSWKSGHCQSVPR